MELNKYDTQLLSFCNQFIPTPKWEKRVVKKERKNLLKHIKALEWKDFLEVKENLVDAID